MLAYVLASLALLILLRPRRLAYVAALIPFAVLLVWWFSLKPSNDRDWQPNVAQLPSAEIHGDTLVVHNLRNFDYRSETDFTPRWETRRYDLSKLRGLDLHVIYWGSPSIAHTILSWEFEDGQRLAASIETRSKVGQSYSAVRGFFRQYELYYVLADERDVIGLRTNHRHEDVYTYRLRTPPARARALLLDYLKTVNRLADKPKWYNAFTDNCTTTIRMHAGNAMGAIPLDWRWMANGYLDELLYEKGVVNRSMPFAALGRELHQPQGPGAAAGRQFLPRDPPGTAAAPGAACKLSAAGEVHGSPASTTNPATRATPAAATLATWPAADDYSLSRVILLPCRPRPAIRPFWLKTKA